MIAVWSLSIYYSVIVSVILVAEYLSIWQEKPWKCKKRDEPPKCLSDPKYGTHKYMLVNVSVFYMLLELKCYELKINSISYS